MANENQLKLKTKVIAVRNLREYHQTVEHCVRSRDAVLEIGCRDGKTAEILAQRCQSYVGVDHVATTIADLRNRHPSIRFEERDGFDVRSLLELFTDRLDVIYVDISQIAGYSALLDSVSLLNMYAAVLRPRTIVVKNEILRAYADRCCAWDPSSEGLAKAQRMKAKPSTKFVATRGVEEFRESIPVWVSSEDVVLEIGCEWGTSTKLIHPHAGYVLGTDVSAKCIGVAKEKWPQIDFDVLDGFDVLAAQAIDKKFTKVYIDISGLSGYRSILDVLSLLRAYETVLQPQAIVIKSGALKHFALHYSAWYSPCPQQ